MYKRVLIPVDGSETAEAILPFILEIAGPLDLDVVLLRVNQPVQPMPIEATVMMPVDDRALEEDAEAYVSSLAAEMQAKGVRVHSRVRRGQPVEQILAAAREEHADLIAMTTHGRTGPARLLFGSVAEGVLRQSDIPVFLMRQTDREVARRRRQEAGR
jgi:nucleotide-binding universal stress UspA family protein